jgi:hypothetical protein
VRKIKLFSSVCVNLNHTLSLNSLNSDKLDHHIRAYLTAADEPYVSLHVFHVWIHIFLNSALVGGARSASCPCHFTSGKRAPQYPLDRRLGGPQSQSGWQGEEKILDPTRTWTLTRRPAHSQSLYRLRYLYIRYPMRLHGIVLN